jgi:hypothetical protein
LTPTQVPVGEFAALHCAQSVATPLGFRAHGAPRFTVGFLDVPLKIVGQRVEYLSNFRVTDPSGQAPALLLYFI